MAQAFETMVRVYKNTRDYQHDQEQLAKQGWLTASMVERKPRAGCARLLLLWWLVLIRPPKPELVVTYQRQKPTQGKAAAPSAAPSTAAAGTGFCPNCGKPVSPTAFYCPNCRTQLRS